jgi:hypothetical protein
MLKSEKRQPIDTAISIAVQDKQSEPIPTCGKYPLDEVLLDNEERCSLCGSLVNQTGECLYIP